MSKINVIATSKGTPVYDQVVDVSQPAGLDFVLTMTREHLQIGHAVRLFPLPAQAQGTVQVAQIGSNPEAIM